MIYKLKTSAETNEKITYIKRQISYSNNIIARIAIAMSLKKESISLEEILNLKDKIDNNGFDFPRHVLYGENEIVYRLLMEKKLQSKLTDEEFFPHVSKHFIETGIELLYQEMKNSKSIEKLIKGLIRGV